MFIGFIPETKLGTRHVLLCQNQEMHFLEQRSHIISCDGELCEASDEGTQKKTLSLTLDFEPLLTHYDAIFLV